MASQVYLVRSRPLRDPVSKQNKKINGTLEVTLSFSSGFHRYKNTYTYMHVYAPTETHTEEKGEIGRDGKREESKEREINENEQKSTEQNLMAHQ